MSNCGTLYTFGTTAQDTYSGMERLIVLHKEHGKLFYIVDIRSHPYGEAAWNKDRLRQVWGSRYTWMSDLRVARAWHPAYGLGEEVREIANRSNI